MLSIRIRGGKKRGVIFFNFETGSPYVAQGGLEFMASEMD